jgi:hypothetical protein
LPIGFIFEIHHLTPGFESGFTGFIGLQRTSSFLAQGSFIEDYVLYRFSPMCYASAIGLAMEAAFNNNLQNQTNDVMVNPRNPDSKPKASAHSMPNQRLNVLVHPTTKRCIFRQ